MKKAGFETIRIGLESASDDFHAVTGGKTTRAYFLAAIRNLKEAGFARDQIGVYLLVGLPGQSTAEIEDDVDEVLRSGAFPKLAEYSPIPGTEMWGDAVRNSHYPIEQEPLFQNCMLLPAADPGIDWAFLRKTRTRVTEYLGSSDVKRLPQP
jgi:MoaA/NifB/PqqE/SkfB family radical SAM enzyme